MGIGQEDVKIVILTHFHTDHAGGLHHFPASKILVSGRDLQLASGFVGKLLGYLPHRWPEWFDPTPIPFEHESLGPFGQMYKVTKAHDIIIVPTSGHTPGHISVLVKSDGINYFLAGDTSYNERLMIERRPDGVSPNARVTLDTMDRILAFADSQPVVYLPTHDPGSEARLKENRILKSA
jgi:glyoxylase-like metal-dependent hydrolase (beta-lactamase superfamily II)